MKRIIPLLLASLWLFSTVGAAQPPNFSDGNWLSMGGLPGVSDLIAASAMDSFGNLYLGGTFTVAGNIFATNVVKWDGTNFTALGAGINGSVLALATVGDELYAGGQFTSAGGIAATNIAKWNGHTWSPVGSGVMGGFYTEVHALAVSGSNVYAGGQFTMAGGIFATNIARWDGVNWSPVGPGLQGYGVSALQSLGQDLYAGGSFDSAGGTRVNNVARWDGTSWHVMAEGIQNGGVNTFAVLGTDLYVAGSFYQVVKWTGTNWLPTGCLLAPELIATCWPSPYKAQTYTPAELFRSWMEAWAIASPNGTAVRGRH